MQNGAVLNGCVSSCPTVGASASPQWTSNGAPTSPTMIAVDSNGSGAGYSPPVYYQVRRPTARFTDASRMVDKFHIPCDVWAQCVVSQNHTRSQGVHRALGARAPPPRAEKNNFFLGGGKFTGESCKCMHPRQNVGVHPRLLLEEIGQIWTVGVVI